MAETRISESRGLTLTETLVVLSLLSVLLVWVVSVTATSRENGRVTVCTSHLRQLLQAAHLYEDDWEGLPVHHPIGIYGRRAHWQEKLLPYAGRNRGLFLCASDPTVGLQNSWGGWATSYIYMYTDVWLGPQGEYRAPRADSPLLLDLIHLRSRQAILVGRYDGSVRSERPGTDHGFLPEDGLGLLR